MMAPKWRFKVRILKSGCGGKEKAYVEMRFVDGKLVIEPYNENSTNASSQEVS